MNANPIIEPENQPTWITVGFVVALLALLLAAVALYRINYVTAGMQAEVVYLAKKVEQLKSEQAKAPAAAPAQPQAAPAAPAPAASTPTESTK